jgi:hypothetical protein
MMRFIIIVTIANQHEVLHLGLALWDTHWVF